MRRLRARRGGAGVAAALLALLAACDDGGGGPEDDRRVGAPDGGPAEAGPSSPPDASADAAVDAGHVGPRINSVIPNRGPLEGGTRLLVVGQDFVPDTQVRIGATPCAEVEYESPNHLRCTTPPSEAEGPVHITVRWPEGGEPDRLDEGFTYFQPLAVEGLSPDRSGVRGGVDVTIEGRGFIEPTEVRFGSAPAARVRVEGGDRLVARAPAGEPGVVDVRLRNINGEAVLEQAFTYTESLAVASLEPRWGWTDGDTEVLISGGGLVTDSAVGFGGAAATVVASELGRARLRVRTPAGAAGPVDVSVENVNGAWREEDAFLYVDRAADTFGVVGVVPRRVPTSGGVPVLVGGGGFTEATRVLIDGEAAPCTLEAPQLLRCTAPPHPRGEVDLTVVDGDREAALPGALFYFERLELFDVRPRRGAVAGGTVVEVVGSGLSERTELFLDGEPMALLEITDGETALAVTPPGRPGLAALRGRSPDDEALLPDAFEYFDPVSRYGGVWGEPIAGAVNVTVLDAVSGEPLVGATVLAVPAVPDNGSAEAEPLRGATDERGQVTLSRPALAGPLNVTAAKAGYEVYTFERVTHENVTLYLYPHAPPDGGNGEPPDPIPPARLSGTVRGIGDLPKPLEPGLVLAAFVDTTHTSPFNRRSLPWPEPNGILFEDGPFEVFARPGELAVIVTAAYVPQNSLDAYEAGRMSYWDLHNVLTPIAMGVQRFISVSPGEVVENLDIAIDKPLDLEIPVTLGNPSGGVEGAPTRFEAWPLLDFGAEGYWSLDTRAEGDTHQLRIRHVADLEAGWDGDIVYQWIGVAQAEGDLGYPYTMTFETARAVREGVVIGPFVGTPDPVHPLPDGALGGNRTIEWAVHPGVEGPTEPPDVNVVQVTDARGLPLWTYVTPGPVTRYTLPDLPDDITPGGLDAGGEMYLSIVPMILDRFVYDDFTYEDLGFWNRRSFSVTSFSFQE